jgi:hypothetical protein
LLELEPEVTPFDPGVTHSANNNLGMKAEDIPMTTKPTSILKKVRLNELEGEKTEKKKQLAFIEEQTKEPADDGYNNRNTRPNKLVGADEYFTPKQKQRVDLYVRFSALISTGYFIISGAISGIVLENSDEIFKTSCNNKSSIL